MVFVDEACELRAYLAGIDATYKAGWMSNSSATGVAKVEVKLLVLVALVTQGHAQ